MEVFSREMNSLFVLSIMKLNNTLSLETMKLTQSLYVEAACISLRAFGQVYRSSHICACPRVSICTIQCFERLLSHAVQG
jgi:hypothetical protein